MEVFSRSESTPNYCHWTVSIQDCEDSHYFLVLAACAILIGATMFFLGCIALYRRYKSNRLASGLTYIDVYILMSAIGLGLGRAIQNILLIADIVPGYMWREAVSAVSVVPAILGAWVYVCSVIAIIPPQSSFYVPPHIFKKVRDMFVVVVTCLMLGFGMVAGHARDRGDRNMDILASRGLYLTCAAAAGIISIGLMIYSRHLIAMLQEARIALRRDLMTTIGASAAFQNIIDPQALVFEKAHESPDERMRKVVVKMQIFYWVYTSMSVWFCISLCAFSFDYDRVILIRHVTFDAPSNAGHGLLGADVFDNVVVQATSGGDQCGSCILRPDRNFAFFLGRTCALSYQGSPKHRSSKIAAGEKPGNCRSYRLTGQRACVAYS
ncbi:hypothetical protein DFS34DRAFT_632114 [Phlyctochytrium arcticum]|nr:hypothetical protein DFS34DRAFT_632114 [Phlyctochytrium arcticum]